ncbi:MAG: hypothetical protein SPI77_01230 [Corynebacterium sp.]|nr:hypothetical protein [Corynebacterium sp.]
MRTWILAACGFLLLILATVLPYPLLSTALTVDPTDSFTADQLTVTVGEPAADADGTILVPVTDPTGTWRIDTRTARTENGELTWFFPAGTIEQTYPVIDPSTGTAHPADFTDTVDLSGFTAFVFTVNDGPYRQFTVEPRTGQLLNVETGDGAWSAATQAERLATMEADYQRIRVTDWLTFVLRTIGGALIIVTVVLWLRARV